MPEIKLREKTKFVVADLCYQYLPGVTSMDIWNHDMSLPNSPQVEVARLLLEHGRDWSVIKKSRYVADRRYRKAAGMSKWTDSYIKQHIFESRYKILRSLKKHGYKKSLAVNQPIAVLREPLWVSRFEADYPWLHGLEIYHGGRRCAAAYVLGIEMLPGFWAEDRYAGSHKRGKYGLKLPGEAWK